MQLILIELLRAVAKLGALQLVQQMLQPIILRQQVIAFCQRGIPLRAASAALRYRFAADRYARSRPPRNQIRAPL
jgi:hypothetical protein